MLRSRVEKWLRKQECLQRRGERAAAGVRTFQKHARASPQQERRKEKGGRRGGTRGGLN